mgnify:CR=1 FL=1
MLDSSQLMLLTNTIGLSILIETLKQAGELFLNVHPRQSILRESRSCFAFIQGSGLEMLLQEWNLDYEAKHLRRAFYNTFHLHQYFR